MGKYGFLEQAKYFRHENCPWIVEFVSPPVSVGNEPVHDFSVLKTNMGTLKLLRPVDCIKDRLASFYHWNDLQALEQAVEVFGTVKGVNIPELRRWSAEEGHPKKFSLFLELIKQRKRGTSDS